MRDMEELRALAAGWRAYRAADYGVYSGREAEIREEALQICAQELEAALLDPDDQSTTTGASE